MKPLLLVVPAFLGLAASGSAARATLFDFTYNGGLVNFTVPTTDTYQILAFGAQGGSGNFLGHVGAGGKGAEIGGDFSLTAGEILQIAVGGVGSDNVSPNGGGGGGGTFVVALGNAPLVIASGGGGGGGNLGGPLSGQGGLTGPDGGGFNGGIGGNGGGGGGLFGGGGGGGFFSAGGDGFSFDAGIGGGTGGAAFPDLTGGVFGGGFGGGGGAGGVGGGFNGGAGGGGGYSGGGGGNRGAGGDVPGGGGGSFDAGTDQILVADFRMGDGEVVITEIAAEVPEPASIALLGAGLVALVEAVRRRRRSNG